MTGSANFHAQPMSEYHESINYNTYVLADGNKSVFKGQLLRFRYMLDLAKVGTIASVILCKIFIMQTNYFLVLC